MKQLRLLILIFFLFTVTGCAVQQQQQQMNSVDHGQQTEAIRKGSFSGTGGQSFRSGVRRPSSNVTNPQPNVGTPNYGTGTPSGRGSFWSHAGSFGAGALVGSMFGSIFHPFGGGYYGYGYGGGFSFIGILFWIVVIGLIFSWFRRRNRNRY